MVDADANKQVRLTERDAAIFRGHIAIFRMTTFEALRRSYWAEETLHAPKSWVRRMRAAGLLEAAPLYGPKAKYFHATPLAAPEFGLPAGVCAPRRPSELAPAFGTLAFCCLLDKVRRKYTAIEFAELFPELVLGPHDQDNYYLDQEGDTKRIGYLFIDARRPVRRIQARLLALAARRVDHEHWKYGVLRKRRFVISVLTTREEKRRQIERALTRFHEDVPLRYFVFPELGHVVPTRRPRRAPER